MATCGRPTLTTGAPCGNLLIGPAWRSCRLHRTTEDIAYMEGWGAALDWARKIQDSVIEAERQNWFEQGRQAAFREVAKTSIFRFIDQGRQVVQVGRYAYAWAGREPLEIGDRVLLPGNWLYPKPSEDTITGQGTSYTGTLSEIIRKI